MKAVVIGLAFAALAAGAASAEQSVSQPSASAGAQATPAFRVGTLVKDDKGAALGRVARVVKATATEPAKVSIRVGDEMHTVLQSQVTTKDGVLVYAPNANVKASLPFSL